jgi:hypothetical protein
MADEVGGHSGLGQQGKAEDQEELEDVHLADDGDCRCSLKEVFI